jgi:deoxyribose-phosphate aldolase
MAELRALARAIDHTLLRPDATASDVARLCEEARRLAVFAVCVQPCFVRQAVHALAGSNVEVAAVAAFPHGASLTASKVFEARRAVEEGAQEVDVVANLGWIRAGEVAAIEDELAAIVATIRPACVKVILETALFPPALIEAAARAAVAAGAAFLKTSTGFGPAGATVEDVRLLRAVAGGSVGVKAAGGIRTRETAQAMLAAGATRIGTSAAAEILQR